MNEKKITFRMAKEKDAGLVMSFIRQLSVYEEMEDSVQATEELLRENTLYVAEEYRREGVGQAIFKKLAEIAKERGYGRIEWICLKENQPGMNFYQKQRANMLDSCVTFRMEEDVMHGLSE